MSDEIIIPTKETPGDYDAIETAKPGEPLFPLQGGDPFAPPCIHLWVRQCREAAMLESDPAKREAMLRKATSAEMVAWAFDDYRNGIADAPPAPMNAQGIPDSAEDLHAADMVRLARVLHNSLAEVVEVAEALESKGFDFNHVASRLRHSAENIKTCANEIEPRRMMRDQ